MQEPESSLAQFYGIRVHLVGCWITYGRVSFALDLWDVMIEVLNSSNNVPPTKRSLSCGKRHERRWARRGSVVRPGRRAPRQREGKKRVTAKVQRWRNRSQCFGRRRHSLIWCRTARWVWGKIFRRIWAIWEWSKHAIGNTQKCRLLETGRQGWIFELDTHQETVQCGHITPGQDEKSLSLFIISHSSRSLMSLLSVPFVRFFSVLSLLTASVYHIRGRSCRKSPSASARWRAWPNGWLFPNTGEPKLASFSSYMDLEHTPINIRDSNHNFLCPDGATVIPTPEGLPYSGASSSSKHSASRVPIVFGSLENGLRKLVRIWTEDLLQQRFLVHSR